MAVNMAWADVTLVAGAGSANLRSIDQLQKGMAAAPTGAQEVVLDFPPQKWDLQRLVAGAAPAELTATVTASTVTLASADAADTGTIRVWVWCRVPPWLTGNGQ